jgi:hypothetical protein
VKYSALDQHNNHCPNIQLFDCNQGAFLVRFLDIAIYYRRLSNADCERVEQHLKKTHSAAGKENIYQLVGA